MDVYVINIDEKNNYSKDVILKFRQKNITNKEKLDVHCFAYFMCDKLLNEIYKIENRELEFINNKPRLKNNKKYFSISHSGEYIAIAFSDNDCGIDIEKIKQRDYKAISKKMNFKSVSLENFYENWTLYEAEFKLGIPTKSSKIYDYNGYKIAVASSNADETYNLV